MARELAKNVHVAHFVIDGGINAGKAMNGPRAAVTERPEPDAIAETYLHSPAAPQCLDVGELRPWVENF